ncbi:hypothetical protein [Ideonella sp. BN130291]|uniref:hypothetical protein n=1 Tax=Ideonella sp. BN130291 TaxID=3112940 RepID=UPI002E25804B|nr:hypothetical protein [Ideonella sp. BN130291]
MNRWIVWAVAVLVTAAGYARFGWQGAVVGITLSVFWLLLEFSRTLRVLRQAGHAPMGHVESAVMLQSKLKPGLRLIDVLKITRSLGERLDSTGAAGPERWRWTDPGGDQLTLALRGGRLVGWELSRAEVAQGVQEPAL